MREARSVDILLLTLLGLIWGSSFFNIKIASYSYEAFTLALIRVIFASLPLILLCKYKKVDEATRTTNRNTTSQVGGTCQRCTEHAPRTQAQPRHAPDKRAHVRVESRR